ncbi:MAG: holo-ACP synthase [Pseudomonadota bacterium]
MILGVGSDIVAIARIQAALARHGARFAERILRPEELAVFRTRPRPDAWLAKRFAAKEALGKALGTGIGAVSWRDFAVLSQSTGAPAVHTYGRARALLAARGVTGVWVSLADERDLALAFVVLTGGGAAQSNSGG